MDRNGYNPSIMQDKEECYITKQTGDLVRHEIYFGSANRKISKEQGFWVWLRPEWHNTSDYSVHFNRALDLRLKMDCQEIYEKTHSREEFTALIGRSYL